MSKRHGTCYLCQQHFCSIRKFKMSLCGLIICYCQLLHMMNHCNQRSINCQRRRIIKLNLLNILKWNNPPSWNCTLSFLGISKWELEVGQPTVQSLVNLHGCAGWPGSILVANTTCNYFGSSRIRVKWVFHRRSVIPEIIMLIVSDFI